MFRFLLNIMISLISLLKNALINSSRIQKLQNDKDWTKNLLSLYIIQKSNGICLFSHHFKLGKISQIENQLVGMGFIAIINMMLEVVDSESRPRLFDLGKKQVLLKEGNNILSILITTRYVKILESKLEEFTTYFCKIFELQQQINRELAFVCAEDYALTSDLVSIIFSHKNQKPLEFIPIIFKTIQKGKRDVVDKKNGIANILRIQTPIKKN